MLVPHGSLILVADGGSMQLLRNGGTDISPHCELIETRHCDNPLAHADGSERPGRAFESAGVARHAYAADDMHQRRKDEFAGTAFAALRRHLQPGMRVIIVAPPRTMGAIRDHYFPGFDAHLTAEIDRDLAHWRPHEIAHFLQHHRE